MTQAERQKRPYAAPKLVEYGAVAEITRNSQQANKPDGTGGVKS